MSRLSAAVAWEDDTFGIIGLSNIVSPRKEFSEYPVGQTVEAMEVPEKYLQLQTYENWR